MIGTEGLAMVGRRSRSGRPLRVEGGKRSIAGQAMVLFVVLVGVLCLAVVLLFNTGQVVNKKVRLTNAADAAAYSVAVQQARAMNYAAYMNRGRIANEVAIAQMVSLWSWSNMIHTHMVEGYNIFEWLATLLGWVPILGQVLQAFKIAYQAGEAVAAAIRIGVYASFQLVPVVDLLNGLLATSADLMLQSGQLGTGWKIADDIVKANDPTASVAPLGILLLQQQLMHAASRGNSGMLDRSNKPANGGRDAGMDKFRNLVMTSRDEFSADRSDEIGLPFIDLEGHGGTDMVEYDRWAAQDTLDLSIGVDIPFFDFTFDAPLGWGGAQAAQDTQQRDFRPGIRSGGTARNGDGWYTDFHHVQDKTYDQYGGVSSNSLSGQWANQYPSVDYPGFVPHKPTGGLNEKRYAYVGNYNGLRSYDDVKAKYGRTPEGDDAGPTFSVYVESAAADARTAQDAGLGGAPGSRFELRQQMDGNKMTAIASSQVYFNRPPANALFKRFVPRGWNANPQADNQLEMGSLFSPYWQARLVETPRDIYAKVGIVAIAAGG